MKSTLFKDLIKIVLPLIFIIWFFIKSYLINFTNIIGYAYALSIYDPCQPTILFNEEIYLLEQKIVSVLSKEELNKFMIVRNNFFIEYCQEYNFYTKYLRDYSSKNFFKMDRGIREEVQNNLIEFVNDFRNRYKLLLINELKKYGSV